MWNLLGSTWKSRSDSGDHWKWAPPFVSCHFFPNRDHDIIKYVLLCMTEFCLLLFCALRTPLPIFLLCDDLIFSIHDAWLVILIHCLLWLIILTGCYIFPLFYVHLNSSHNILVMILQHNRFSCGVNFIFVELHIAFFLTFDWCIFYSLHHHFQIHESLTFWIDSLRVYFYRIIWYFVEPRVQ